jgi:Na+-transporting NADH:ubiquinone oxidoreductase subunit A
LSNFKITKGHTLILNGIPEKKLIEISSSDIIKINPHDYKYIKPKVLLKINDEVKVGTPIFIDKNDPDVMHVSPCSGKIESIDYGDKRKILSINIINDKKYDQIELLESKKLFSISSIKDLGNNFTRKIINEAGMWPLIRQRPFSKIPKFNSKPKSIFISMNPTYPLAPDQLFILENDSLGFVEGLDAISNLTEGDINLILGKGQDPSLVENLDKVKTHSFSGPHPSGNVGIHIHYVDPIVSKDDTVWYLSPQDVCKIGKIFIDFKIDTTKTITMGGPGCQKPSYLKIVLGTKLEHIFNELELVIDENKILISGDVLSGKYTNALESLNVYHECLSIIKKSESRSFLGWILPGFSNFTLTNVYISKLLKNNTTANHNMLNGSKRAIVPLGLWEKVLPMNLLPNFLIRSILCGDIEDMERLGIYECSEEDFALCSLICQSKIEVSQIIQDGLDLMYLEG